MTPAIPLCTPERPLSATRLAQYVTVRGRCERYLRLALFPSEGQALMHRYGVRPEALSPSWRRRAASSSTLLWSSSLRRPR